MCKRIQCEHCLKVGFSGCGKHLEQVFRGVADGDRCRCHEVASRFATSASLAAASQALRAGVSQAG